MKEFGVELSKKATVTLLTKTKGNEKNPTVTLDDFLKMMTPYVRKKVGALLETSVALNPFELLVMKREFSRADADGSGFIDEKELAAIIKCPKEEAKQLVAQHGADGQINFDGFVKVKIEKKGPGVGAAAAPAK
jgi:Ca2+-binding EF-hand superfamily protein